jgi:hypothetical protein
MKKGILFALAFAMVAASIALCLYGTTKGTAWPLLAIPLTAWATWIYTKTNFKTDDDKPVSSQVPKARNPMPPPPERYG